MNGLTMGGVDHGRPLIMNGGRPYVDRAAAGRALADEVIGALAGHDHGDGQPLVLALPRGGVPVAIPVARALAAELSVLVVRKLGAPGQPELAVGAIAAIGDQIVRVLNDHWVRRLGLSAERLSTHDRHRDRGAPGPGEAVRYDAAGRRPHRHPGRRRPGHRCHDAGRGDRRPRRRRRATCWWPPRWVLPAPARSLPRWPTWWSARGSRVPSGRWVSTTATSLS